ncbi:MAG: helix-turn-helix domain-containing protein [Clostridia bacterium]|nr:helix-turn-helix domain-containing protein [Clostridia bacterium]
MEIVNIYELGKKAKNGDNDAMLKIIKLKRGVIRKYSYGDEDCYQSIILNLIKGIKNYNF